MKNRILTDFGLGFIFGFIAAIFIFGVITFIYFYRVKEKELIEYVQRQQVIEELQENISNLDYLDLLDTVPGVRRAADNTVEEFERKRDEILQRFRSRIAD